MTPTPVVIIGVLIWSFICLPVLGKIIAFLDRHQDPPPPETRAASPRLSEAIRSTQKDPEQALAGLKPRILAKEYELGALRAEEFRLLLETGRIRDPYRGGVTDDCVQMPALTDDVLRGASKGKA